MSLDKGKAIESALAQIEKKFGKGSIMKLSGDDTNKMDVEAISTGSLGLDIALGIGGLPRGRIIEIFGPESSGKTTLALQVIAEAQKAGGTCAIVDAEHALVGAREVRRVGSEGALNAINQCKDVFGGVLGRARRCRGDVRRFGRSGLNRIPRKILDFLLIVAHGSVSS